MIFLKKSRDLARGRPLERPLEHRLNFGLERPSSARSYSRVSFERPSSWYRAEVERPKRSSSARGAFSTFRAPYVAYA